VSKRGEASFVRVELCAGVAAGSAGARATGSTQCWYPTPLHSQVLVRKVLCLAEAPCRGTTKCLRAVTNVNSVHSTMKWLWQQAKVKGHGCIAMRWLGWASSRVWRISGSAGELEEGVDLLLSSGGEGAGGIRGGA
jgi:hypothetical protein